MKVNSSSEGCASVGVRVQVRRRQRQRPSAVVGIQGAARHEQAQQSQHAASRPGRAAGGMATKGRRSTALQGLDAQRLVASPDEAEPQGYGHRQQARKQREVRVMALVVQVGVSALHAGGQPAGGGRRDSREHDQGSKLCAGWPTVQASTPGWSGTQPPSRTPARAHFVNWPTARPQALTGELQPVRGSTAFHPSRANLTSCTQEGHAWIRQRCSTGSDASGRREDRRPVHISLHT